MPSAAARTVQPPGGPVSLPHEPGQAAIGSATGLPLPRFAALRSDEVNLRAGPGTRFPIEWTFQRRNLPVEIIREFDLWRRVRAVDGTEGWVHSSTLTGRRTFIARGTGPDSEVVLRREPDDSAPPVARLRPGVVGRLRVCAPGSAWCEAQVAGYSGYLRRSEIYGVGPDEEVN